MPTVRVTSEVGPLRAVLANTPGNELLAVTPRNRSDYLYEDLIDLEQAQRQHRRLERALIAIEGAEPVRGGRGPRCRERLLRRDDL